MSVERGRNVIIVQRDERGRLPLTVSDVFSITQDGIIDVKQGSLQTVEVEPDSVERGPQNPVIIDRCVRISTGETHFRASFQVDPDHKMHVHEPEQITSPTMVQLLRAVSRRVPDMLPIFTIPKPQERRETIIIFADEPEPTVPDIVIKPFAAREVRAWQRYLATGKLPRGVKEQSTSRVTTYQVHEIKPFSLLSHTSNLSSDPVR